MTPLLAFGAAAAAAAAAAELASLAARPALVNTTRVVAFLAASAESFLRLGREGREPGAVERRRLLVAGAALAFCAGAFMFGPLAGGILALAAPTAVSQALHARRRVYREAVARDAHAIARAVADALSGGHSLRGALSEAAAGLRGAGGTELRRVASELVAGATTDDALERLRRRAPSPALDAVVAATLVGRRSGGDLGRLLRSLAQAFEDQRRLEDEVRTATAQARFTGLLVVLLPLGGTMLAELADPGFVVAMLRSPISAWFVAVALVLQLSAALFIHRLGKVRG